MRRVPATGKDRVRQRAQRADGIPTGARRLTYHVNVNGPQLAHGHVEIKVLIDAADVRLQVIFDLRVLQSGDTHASDLRQKDVAVPVHPRMNVEINLTPCPDHELIAGTDNIIGRHRGTIHRSERRGHILEETGAVNGKWLT